MSYNNKQNLFKVCLNRFNDVALWDKTKQQAIKETVM